MRRATLENASLMEKHHTKPNKRKGIARREKCLQRPNTRTIETVIVNRPLPDIEEQTKMDHFDYDINIANRLWGAEQQLFDWNTLNLRGSSKAWNEGWSSFELLAEDLIRNNSGLRLAQGISSQFNRKPIKVAMEIARFHWHNARGALEIRNPYQNHFDRRTEFEIDGRDGLILNLIYKERLGIKGTAKKLRISKNTVKSTLAKMEVSIRDDLRCMDICDICATRTDGESHFIASTVRMQANGSSSTGSNEIESRSNPGEGGVKSGLGNGCEGSCSGVTMVTTLPFAANRANPVYGSPAIHKGMPLLPHRYAWLVVNKRPIPPYHDVHHRFNDPENNEDLICVDRITHWLIHVGRGTGEN